MSLAISVRNVNKQVRGYFFHCSMEMISYFCTLDYSRQTESKMEQSQVIQRIKELGQRFLPEERPYGF